MSSIQATQAEREGIADGWAVVRAFWAELRRRGWLLQWPELYAMGEAEDYSSYINIDITEPYIDGVVVTVMSAGLPHPARHHLRSFNAEYFAKLLSEPRPARTTAVGSASLDALPPVHELAVHADQDRKTAFQQEASARDEYSKWHHRIATLLGADMLIQEIAEWCLAPDTLEPNEHGRGLWRVVTELPIVGMPTFEEDPTDWGRGTSASEVKRRARSGADS